MSSSSVSAAAAASPIKPNLRWRIIDILVAAVLGVAVGFIFVLWNSIGGAGYSAVNAITPGLGGLVTGVWFLGGPLGAAIIRKPGAAILVEVIAASVSAAVGNQWGISVLWSGIVQGLGSEIVVAIFAYRVFNNMVIVASGMGAGVAAVVFEFITGNAAKGVAYNLIYLISCSISGIVLAGVLTIILTRALAATGALDRFAAGREQQLV